MECVEWSGNFSFVSVRQESAGMKYSFSEVLQNQQAQGDSGEGEEIGRTNKKQIQSGILNPGWHVFTLDLLEVQFGEDMEPVSNLNDVKELEHKSHLAVWITFPKLSDTEQIFTHDYVASP